MADDNFLSRWSRRKVQVQRGEEPPPEPLPEPAAAPAPPAALQPAPAPLPADGTAAVETPAPAEPPPTLADVETLTPQADFSRFVKPDVEPGVQRAALKKLFADPHYNVMDGLDVYIDDYNTPDPLPKSMLRQMVQSRLLGLFDDDPAPPQPGAAAATGPASTQPATDDAAPAAAPEAALSSETAADEDPDLRLQPDDAAGPADAGEGAGAHAGREP
jgi:hypothetical protein